MEASQRPAVRYLDKAAVVKLLEDGEASEYLLELHNRGVESLADPSAWTPLTRVGRACTLRTLDLSFNRLRALGPMVLASLLELRELKLYSNRLTDEVIENANH